jgi:hypothetical protein
MSVKHKNKIHYFLICLMLFAFLSPTELSAKHKKKRKKHHTKVETQAPAQAPIVANWQEELRVKVENSYFPAWMFAQITKDLEPFEEMGITLEAIENTIQRYDTAGLMLCTIENNQLTWSCHPPEAIKDFRCKMLTDAINALTQAILLPNVTFLVYIGETFPWEENQSPIFTWCRHKERGKKAVCLPDYEALNGNCNFLREVSLGTQYYPWESKQNLAVWRGAPTGLGIVEAELLNYPRTQLVQVSKLFPQFIDAKLTGIFPGQDGSIFDPFMGNTLSVTEHLQYKYQILVDGHVSAFSRAYWELFSNCVIFKHESPWYQWFYSQLQPYVHYIPYKADASDLVERLIWAMEHDEEAHQISRNANDFANKNLKHSDVMLYVYLLLIKYAQLQRF